MISIAFFFLTHDLFIEPKSEKTKYSIWLQKEVNNSIQQNFLNRVPLYCGWFHWFCYFRVRTILSNQKLKMQNTVSGYKEGSKIQSDKIFWSATPKLWVVSFAIFDSWPFYQAKSWKTQNTVFGYKKGSKIQSDKIFWSATPNLWVVSFATFVSKWPEHR